MSYYDVDAILTDAQKVPCTFEITIPNGGYLDGNAGEDMKSGTRAEIPYWLGSLLAAGSRSITSTPIMHIDLPPSLSQRVINALKADPLSVDLRAQAPHFYGLAEQVFNNIEDDDVIDVLLDTFKTRASTIADHANNPRGALGEGADFLRGLDETERALFRAAHDGAKGVRSWIGEGKSG